MKALFFTFCLSLCAIFGYSTTIYDIRYKFQDEIEYTAFMVRYDNGTGFMRVRYYNAKKEYRVVNMDFVEEASKQEINGRLYDALKFVGKNPSFILGNSDETESYNPDYIWFCKLDGQKDYKPWGVTSPDAKGNVTQGTITSVKLLNTSELTESYVNSFFGSSEPFYVNLFNRKPIPSTANVSTTTATSSSNTTKYTGSIKLIMVANTLDRVIGSTCVQDVERVKGMFSQIAGVLKLNFVVTEVSGYNFSKESLLKAVNGVSSNVNDIIVFCYTGHGFHFETDLNNPYPQMDLRMSAKQDVKSNTVNVTEINAFLKSQPAHLKLILTDCCNAFMNDTKQFGKSKPSTARSNIQLSQTNCENLFKRQTGTIIASAASVGEIARCNEQYGGYFIFNFMQSLEKSISVFGSGQSWQNILAETKENVLEMSRLTECEAKICTQTAIGSVNTK